MNCPFKLRAHRNRKSAFKPHYCLKLGKSYNTEKSARLPSTCTNTTRHFSADNTCVFLKRPKTGRERLVFCFFNVLSRRPNLQSVAKSFCSKYCFMHLFIISLTSSSLSCNPLNCVWLGKGIEKQKQLEKVI